MGGGVEAALARVEGAVAEGKLAEAAEALEVGAAGTAAAPAVAAWARDARARQRLEQALTVLRAHAAAAGAALA